jgi:heptosyltransferase-1
VPLVAIFAGSDPGLTGPKGLGPIEVIGGKGHVPSITDVLGAVERIL